MPASPMWFRPKLLCLIAALLLLIGLTPGTDARAHEIRPALLNIVEQEPGWFEVTWKVPMRSGLALDIHPVLPPGLTAVGPPASHPVPGAITEYTNYKAEGGSLVGETISIDGLRAVQIDVLVQIEFADGRPRRSSERSTTSSWSNVAVCSSSTAAARYGTSNRLNTRGPHSTPVSMNAIGGVTMLREAIPETAP